MKLTAKTAICALCILACTAPVVVAGDITAPKTTQATSGKSTSTKSLKSIFQNAIGKYPYEIKLLKKPALKARLVKLMGVSRDNVMCKNFDVQTPVEFSNWNYHTMACQAHNCGGTEFEISYNPETDNLCVRYRVDGEDKFFKEKPGNAIWDYNL